MHKLFQNARETLKNDKKKKYGVFAIVYLTFFLDNVLLTVVVPIIPDYLHTSSLNLLAGTGSPIFNNYINIKNDSRSKLNINLNSKDRYEENTPKVIKKDINSNMDKNLKLNDKEPVHTLSDPKVTNMNDIPESKDFNSTKALRAPNVTISGKFENNDILSQIRSFAEKLNRDITQITKRLGYSSSETDSDVIIKQNSNLSKRSNLKPSMSEVYQHGYDKENVPVGILLSSKALVQLALNPFIGNWISKVGYRIPMIIGTCNLLIASLLFAVSSSWWCLLMARAIQGAGSSCVGVSGMCLATDLFLDHEERSRNTGILLGSVALGVLIGYPFGGIVYELANKSAPFVIIAVFLTIDLDYYSFYFQQDRSDEVSTKDLKSLMKNVQIMIIIGAIFTTTSAMAVLEPCLPIWMLDHLNPKKWQLGTVFIPDSVGYLVGTNVFGLLSIIFGQFHVGVTAVFVVGLASCMIARSTSLWTLATPQFILGLGIGAADSALVPSLALITQTSSIAMSSVFTVHQSSVSFAYFLAPLLGSEISHWFGFETAMKGIGLINMIYAPILYYTLKRYRQQIQYESFHMEELSISPQSQSDDISYNNITTDLIE